MLKPGTQSLRETNTGRLFPVQRIGSGDTQDRCEFVAEIKDAPACGYRVLACDKQPAAPTALKVTDEEICNEHYRIRLTDSENGCFSVADLNTGKTLIEAGCQLCHQMDPERDFEQLFKPQETWELNRPTSIDMSIREQGPVSVCVRWTMRLVSMQIHVDLTVYASSRRLDLAVETVPDDPGAFLEGCHSLWVTCRCPERGEWRHATPLSRMKRRATPDHDDLMDFQMAREFVACEGADGGVALLNRGNELTRVYLNEIQWWFERYGSKKLCYQKQNPGFYAKSWPLRLEAALLPFEAGEIAFAQREAEEAAGE